jgi:transcription-repair coupling factor (superfamily II helicase)
LLAKQHYNNFTSRFSDYKNIKIAELSRFKTTKEAKEIKENLQKGEVSIVIGTHALLSKTVKFKNLGLLIIDEEQRFGVEHKEKLKTISENVHVLTLTATPIPRTLQLSLSGIKELSLITTPPINRKPIDTYITNKDFLLIKDILIRELSRGGQIFYVTPRIKQINQIYEKLSQLLPELKIAIANGQMPSKQLEKVINDFTNKKHNLLLSTNIIESGIDIPSVNTLIVNRPDLFGLAELYQLRGRIGRSTEKAYCYLLLDETHSLKPNTKKKLEIIKQMDYLGAGFKIASYDLDMRGAGNLLGEEQSGHIKEVGIELYNHMLEDTIKRLKSEQKSEIEKKTSSYTLHEYSPEIITNLNARIPNNYIKDSDVRLEIYTKISKLYNKSMIYDFKKELRDRFGEYPNEVDNLLYISELKLKCWDLNVNKLSVGSKGVLIGFYKNSPKNPEKLLNYITQNANLFKIKSEGELMYLKPPHKETYKQDLSKILNLLNNVIFEGNAT